jgi:predicted deacylase
MNEIVKKCDCEIDLHTGAIHRPNLPHVRVNLDTEGSESLGKAFNVPVILDSKLRDGLLREAASNFGIPVLVYEGGEALRFEELAAKMGVRGIDASWNPWECFRYTVRRKGKAFCLWLHVQVPGPRPP